jgi:hypothetical protein
MIAHQPSTIALIIGAVFFWIDARDVALGTVVSDWHTFRAAPATTLSGQGTNNPTVGSLSETANASFVLGYLPTPFALINPGDFVQFTFNVSFNDAVGMTNAGDNFRFALFDLNGQTPVITVISDTAGVDGQTDDFRGYIFGVKNGSGTGSGGSIRERIAVLASGDNSFAATGANSGSAPSLGAVGGDPILLSSSVNGDGTGPLYSGNMTLTKTGTGVDLAGSFNAGNSTLINLFSATDNTDPFPSNFGAVGFLIGNGLSVDEVHLSNVLVVPEPTTSGFFAATLALHFLRRRRR